MWSDLTAPSGWTAPQQQWWAAPSRSPTSPRPAPRTAPRGGRFAMLILGIETSCDETAAAVVQDGRRALSNVVASQVDIHREYGVSSPRSPPAATSRSSSL